MNVGVSTGIYSLFYILLIQRLGAEGILFIFSINARNKFFYRVFRKFCIFLGILGNILSDKKSYYSPYEKKENFKEYKRNIYRWV